MHSLCLHIHKPFCFVLKTNVVQKVQILVHGWCNEKETGMRSLALSDLDERETKKIDKKFDQKNVGVPPIGLLTV